MRKVFIYVKNNQLNPIFTGCCWIDGRDFSASNLSESDEQRAYILSLITYLSLRVPQNIEIHVSDKRFYEKLKAYCEGRAYFFGTNRENILLWQRFDSLVNKWCSFLKPKYLETSEELVNAKKYVNRINEVIT